MRVVVGVDAKDGLIGFVFPIGGRGDFVFFVCVFNTFVGVSATFVTLPQFVE